MARAQDKSKVIALRKKGLSYSQIKTSTGISKSTLSGWLQGMPLSDKRTRELRDFSSIRIERYRNTMLKKRNNRLDIVYKKVSKDIDSFSKRDLFIAGLFLYWGEGTKVTKYMTIFTNTDPDMVKFFIKWLRSCFDIKKSKFTVLLHLYSDMDTKNITEFWSKKLGIDIVQFKKPYIKDSKLSGLTYKGGFGKGTCNVSVGGRDLAEYIKQSLKYLRTIV